MPIISLCRSRISSIQESPQRRARGGVVTDLISISRGLGEVALPFRALGTKSLAGLLGPANVLLAAGVPAYDIGSVGLCAFSGDSDSES